MLSEDNTLTSDQELNCTILRTFFDKSPQGVLVIESGKVLYINKTWADYLGLQPELVIGKEVNDQTEFFNPDEQQSIIQRFMTLSRSPNGKDNDRVRLTGRDGVRRVLELTASSQEISGKTFVVVYGTDVTSDEISREIIARERKLYGIVAEAALSKEGVSNVCMRVLEGLIEVLGFSLGTIRLYDSKAGTLNLAASVNLDRDKITSVVSKDDPNTLSARTARTLEPLVIPDINALTESADRMMRAKELGIKTLIFWPIIGIEQSLQGVINVASTSIKALDEGDKRFFTALTGMLATILERHKAEEQLRESQEQFIAFADNMPGPVFIKDHESKVLYVNHFMTSRSPSSDRKDLSNVDLFRIDRARQLTEEDQKVLARGPIDRVQEVYDQDGKIRTYRSHKFPIFREGKPPLIGGFSLDITELVEAQKESNEARTRAEWATDLMSHDLNNMHQGIMGSLELLLVDSELPEHLRTIAENALLQVNRSVSLIANVKKFSMVNKHTSAFEKTDPSLSLIEAIEILKQSFPTREIKIETNITTGQYCIMADDFLQDVFYNILHNAVKATPTDIVKLQVDVKLIENGEFLRLDFIDWGEGIDDRLKQYILTGLDERIRRVSGVGLTLVKQIIDHYGGKIWVEDRIEGNHSKGARFVVLLPHGC